MTYSSLLTAIYNDYDRLLPAWESEREDAGAAGVFAFFPDDYATARDLAGCAYAFWPRPRVADYLHSVGLTDEGYMELLEGFEPGAEFLVMIVERLGEEKKAVHIHRITRLGAN